MTTWCLEVVRFLTDPSEWSAAGSKLVHVGYMDAHFRTRKDAASYYDRHHAGRMRPLNGHGTWESDWDPDTQLKYIVRKWCMVATTVPPFSLEDASTVVATSSGSHTTTWQWLR